jgi:hypothetical protein
MAYERVKDMIKAGNGPMIPRSLMLKNGLELVDITPYAVLTSREDPQKYDIYYLDDKRKAARVCLTAVRAIDDAQGTGEYQEMSLIRFTYFSPNNNFPEDKRRHIKPAIDIFFGNAHEKFGETGNDFYIVGADTQYIDMPIEQRQRKFPIWRMGGYGDQFEQIKNFFR